MPDPGTPTRILIVADDESTYALVADAYREGNGFEVLPRSRTDRPMTELRIQRFDLVVFAQEEGALTFLRALRAETDLRPVLLVRAPGEGPRLSWGLEALSLGGFVFLERPAHASGIDRFARDLRSRSQLLVEAAQRRIERDSLARRTPGPLPPLPTGVPRIKAIGIAISTGGPGRLLQFFRDLTPGLGVPIFVVQHMPAEFTKGFAASLDRAGNWRVVEAEHGMPVRRNVVFVAPGDWHLRLGRGVRSHEIRLDQGPPENACRPSADVLFRSLAEHVGAHTLALVMTGMGEDGMRGCHALRDAGATILAQDEASSTVWGMPGSVVRAGLADAIVPGDRMPEAVVQVMSRARPV